MQRFLALFIRSFFKGLIILLPLAITAYVLWAVFDSVDQLVPWDMPRGLGFLLIISSIAFVGFLGLRWSIGQVTFDFIGNTLARTPGIKHIYSSVKDILDSFVGDKRKFNRPVWLQTSAEPQMWRVGFLTQGDMSTLGMPGFVSVYLPHSYAISGWVVLAERRYIKPIHTMTAAEAMKFAVSGGITTTVGQPPVAPSTSPAL